VSGFGRKGLDGAQQPSQGFAPQRGHTAQNGIEGLRNSARGPALTQPRNSEMSQRTSAFLAGERSRNAQLGSAGGISDAAAGYRNSAKPERSLTMAYVLWFFGGQVSAHRFYLGAYRSACAQVGLLFGPLLIALALPKWTVISITPLIGASIVAWALWVLGDVFFIHRIHRNLCRKPGESAAAFA